LQIFIMDEVVIKPGRAREFDDAYRGGYLPGAEQRGMKLENAWQSPPGFTPKEVPTTLYYIWSVEGVAGWWKMRLTRRPDGSDSRYEKLAWWQSAGDMIERRKRVMLTEIV
jgi:hypothetical protein